MIWLDLSDQGHGVKRFGQIAERAQLHRFLDFGGHRTGGQENNGNRLRFGIGFERFADLESAHLREHHVQEDKLPDGFALAMGKTWSP